MRYARDIVKRLSTELQIEIPVGPNAMSQKDSSDGSFSAFGSAAGAFSAASLFAFYEKNSDLIENLYKSGKFALENWQAVQLAWETKELFDVSFVEATRMIHELHHLDIDGIGDALDHLDLMDVMFHAIEGMATVGVGLVAGKGVEWIGKRVNAQKLTEKASLQKELEKKLLLIELLKKRAAPQVLEKLFWQLPPEARAI